MRKVGLEPTRLAAQEPKSSASAISPLPQPFHSSRWAELISVDNFLNRFPGFANLFLAVAHGIAGEV